MSVGKWLLPAAVLAWALGASAQGTGQLPSAPSPERLCRLSSLDVCVKHVAQDEAGIVVSPLRAPRGQFFLAIPLFGAMTGLAVHYDTEAIQDLGVHPRREDRFNTYSDYAGLYAPFAAAAAGYGIGSMRHSDYMVETAVLSAEAMADAGILGEGLKYALDRENPQMDNARGGLWPDGPKGWPNSPSMPSEHAMNVSGPLPTWWPVSTTALRRRPWSMEPLPPSRFRGSWPGSISPRMWSLAARSDGWSAAMCCIIVRSSTATCWICLPCRRPWAAACS